MKSIYQQAVGDQFNRLHPVLQKKFSIHSQSRYRVLGKGRMTSIQGGGQALRFFSRLGLPFALTFPERGEGVPFTIENKAFKDSEGSECVSWERRFEFPSVTRSFDAVMKSGLDEFIQDDFGRGGYISSPLSFQVTNDGGLLIRSTMLNVNLMSKKSFVIPEIMSVRATVLEEYDSEAEAIRVHVHLYQPVFGTVLMYHGLVHTTFPETGGKNE